MKKSLLTIFAILTMALSAKSQIISGECGKTLTWNLDTISNTLTINGIGDMYNYKIVNYQNSAPWCEYIKKIKNICIGDSVTYIGNNAFLYCNRATSVVLGKSVIKIGKQAFSCCSKIESIEFPSSLVNLGVQAFMACESIKVLRIPESIKNINEGCFKFCDFDSIIVAEGNANYDSRDNCNALIITQSSTLVCPSKNTVLPNTLKRIGKESFRDNKSIKSIDIPNSVTVIEQLAFSDCENLKTVHFGESLTNISDYAFLGCELIDSIYIPKSVKVIGSAAFSHCEGLVSIKVDPENTIYDSRNDCNALIKTKTSNLIVGCNNTIIPKDIKSIEGSAFSDCEGLTEVIIPYSVTFIGNAAFSSCCNIKLLSLPKALKTIDLQAFYGCVGLDTVYCFAEVPPTCELEAFQNVNYNCILFVPYGCSNAYKEAYEWNKFKNIIELAPDYGIDENQSVEVSIFPNPATDFVNVNCENMKEIQVFSVDGKIIKSIATQGAETQLDMRDMPRGTYFLRIKSKDRIVMRKIVKE